MPAQSGNELRTLGVILHDLRIGLRVRQHFSGGIDHRRARTCCLRFLGRNIRQTMLAVGLYPLRKHQGLFFEVALNLFAKGMLPHPANRDL